MTKADINQYEKETTCRYKGETYSVRDNGAVFRHRKVASRLRPCDEYWTFGKPNYRTGYMEIASVRIHRIVATAFHGTPPTKEHVVDHIDTNKRNNREENLRWVTKLENVLLNPITVKRIEVSCGCSIEEFLDNPIKFRNRFQEPNFQWMYTVSKEEAQTCKERLLAWAESDALPSGGTLGEWIYNPEPEKQFVEEVPEFTESLTPNAKQKNWRTPSEFPCCPKEPTDNPIATYFANLKVDKVFSRNQYSSSIIEDYTTSEDNTTLWVMCRNSEEDAVKPWSLAQVFYEDEAFVHKSLGSFFQKDGAEKQFTLAQGLEWTGGDTFDDYTS